MSLAPAPQINKKSGAILAVRGQYMPALEKEQALQRGYVCRSLCAVHLWTPSLSTCIGSVCCEVTLSSSATCYREKALHIHIQAPQQSNVDCKCVCVCVHACVRAYVRARVCVHVRVCMCMCVLGCSVEYFPSSLHVLYVCVCGGGGRALLAIFVTCC